MLARSLQDRRLQAHSPAQQKKGLAASLTNERLVAEIESELAEAQAEGAATEKPARRFRDFSWCTLDSWSRYRRVVGKAEWTGGEANPQT